MVVPDAPSPAIRCRHAHRRRLPRAHRDHQPAPRDQERGRQRRGGGGGRAGRRRLPDRPGRRRGAQGRRRLRGLVAGRALRRAGGQAARDLRQGRPDHRRQSLRRPHHAGTQGDHRGDQPPRHGRRSHGAADADAAGDGGPPAVHGEALAGRTHRSGPAPQQAGRPAASGRLHRQRPARHRTQQGARPASALRFSAWRVFGQCGGDRRHSRLGRKTAAAIQAALETAYQEDPR